MKRRRTLDCESLERRDLPAVAFRAAVLNVELPPADQVGQSEPPAADIIRRLVAAQAELAPAPADGSLSSEAVGAFFADSGEVGSLFSAHQPGPEPPAYHPAALDGLFGPPAEVSTATAAPADSTRQADALGCEFLRNYAAKAIRNEERARGPLSGRHDLVQQIYVEWREEVGPGDDVHSRLLDKASAERSALRGTVRRVLDRSRYDDAKRRAVAEINDRPAPARRTAQDWLDLEIDWSQGVGRLTTLERRVLDLRRAGATFDEVGEALGLSKQRAFELYDEVIERLSALYRD